MASVGIPAGLSTTAHRGVLRTTRSAMQLRLETMTENVEKDRSPRRPQQLSRTRMAHAAAASGGASARLVGLNVGGRTFLTTLSTLASRGPNVLSTMVESDIAGKCVAALS